MNHTIIARKLIHALQKYWVIAPSTLDFDLVKAFRDIEDRLVPQLPLSLMQRAIYYHLLRLTHMEGTRHVHISLMRLGQNTHISDAGARIALHGLASKGVIRIGKVNTKGHHLEIKLPWEVRHITRRASRRAAKVESIDFFHKRDRRVAIYQRENYRCFYCLRLLTKHTQMLDHVIPQVKVMRMGRKGPLPHSYRNLVACCDTCNFGKKEQGAADFLRRLYRDGQLSKDDLRARFAALRDLTKGRLKPAV
ncbi:MAG: HNH endonuclease [Acidobacteria bacterium]|nr:HNH endonuclease [Acidobacteriota bacterium]